MLRPCRSSPPPCRALGAENLRAAGAGKNFHIQARDSPGLLLQRLDDVRHAGRWKLVGATHYAEGCERRTVNVADRHPEGADPRHQVSLADAEAAAFGAPQHPLQRAYARIAEARQLLQVARLD